jgi:ribokinase
MTQASIVVLGGINMDLVTFASRFPSAGETVVGKRFLTYAGGKGANQAVAAARMGARSAMVGRVGDDMFGPQLHDGLKGFGVDVSRVGVANGESSGIAVVNIDDTTQNRIIQILGANTTCGDAEAAGVIEALADASILMLQLEVPVELSARVASKAAAMGKSIILDPGPVRPFPVEMYQHCNVITPNETEAEALVGFPVTGTESARNAAEVLLGRGVRAVVVKLGAQGAVYASATESGHQVPYAVAAVDSVATGDAFNGALAVCLAEGMTLATAVKTAAAAGALAVTTTGAQDSMPSRRDVEALMERQPL